MTDGKIEIENGKGYQHTGNCGVLYDYKDGNLSVTKSLFGYGSTTLVIPFFNKEEFIKYLQSL